MKLGDDLNLFWIYVKGFLFIFIVVTSALLLLFEGAIWRRAMLIGVLIWSSARSYYFMFYVIEKYVDREYKFSSVYSFIVYLIQKRKTKNK
ncbi:hypothetical protein [Candidatus Uabimicrobium amorphum]|uniref:Uncharacterized protein n=1 Tax=Uabimicrobium amorphum TaxID=2596890 RepID=A0A5S9F767_UABAM|nr:hypothetical protein [Candidatus Uabimicrobium amorphum]BBM88051.1 hypothetical protein UABAM_06467 [Candidatus Uabimicrobium amorphum]